VASVAVAVAPLCNILNIKVLDDKGSGTEEDVVMGIDHVISLHDEAPEIAPSVINLSLGGPDDGNPYNPVRVACRAAIDRGIWVIAAAGNDGPYPGTIMSPASERYVAAIGSAKYLAAERTFVVSTFSSRGPTKEGLVKPDAVMFGEDIIMASSSSDTTAVAKSGTSFAASFVSGFALLYHEGIYRRAVTTRPITGIYPEITGLVSIHDMLDIYLSGISIKPQGVLAEKDYDYGYGLPFGPLVKQAIGFRPAIDIPSLVTGLAVVVMLGMMLRAVT
jgi:serine protease AprX